MKKTPWIPLGVEILRKEGIPKDTLIVTVPHTQLWLEFKAWTNGRFRVCICEPHKDRKKLVTQSIEKKGVEKLIDFALLPHKDAPTRERLLADAKEIITKKPKRTKPLTS